MASLSASTPINSRDANRVWTTQELSILHELQKPTAIVVSAVYENPHSPQGLKDTVRVLFANEELIRQFGPPRPADECSHLLSLASAEAKDKRRSWLSKAAMGKHGHSAWIESRQLMMPIFSGVTLDSPSRMLRVDSKPIRVETSPGHVEMALMHVMESEVSSSQTDLRVAAMHDRSPIHTFLFDTEGTLLTANKMALLACQRDLTGLVKAGGDSITLKTLFEYGQYPGGLAEAQAAYDEAVNAVFNLQVDCHRHAQPHLSRKDNRTKWSMIEMWPMADPVTSKPAVLIKRYNISQQKELELQLASQQLALQRQNQELEQDSVAMHEQQRKLQREANSLAQRLEAVLQDKFTPRTAFDADTPIDKTLKFLQECIGGDLPPVQIALDLYNILSESDTNLRQPVGLENQLLENSLGSEVGRSMLQLLQGNVTVPRGADPLVIQGPVCMVSDAADRTLVRHGSVSRRDLLQPPGQQLFVPANIMPDVERRLKDAESNWQFDIFGFAEATPGTSLSMLTYHLMKQTRIISEYHLDEAKLCRYLQKIESGYDPANPYHNSIHVASVVQMTHMLLCHGGVLKNKAMGRMQQVATYWSACVHDHEHGGLNNDFLVKTRHPLALTYNDQSPLENHHVASASKLICQPEYQYLPLTSNGIPTDKYMQLRLVSVNQVLGTDMKKHFDITSRFQAAFKRPAAADRAEGADVAAAIDWDQIKPEDRTLIDQMVLKCADIGHLAAAPRTHKRWAYQLEEEFFRQGDKERGVGLPVSPLMDRSSKGGMTRSQMGFFSIVGIPLFKAMAELFEDAQPMLDGVLANYRHWEVATPDADLPAVK